MKSKLCVLIGCLFLFSCNQMNAPGRSNQFENQTYVYLFFETEEECLRTQPPDFFINCHQQLDFMEDNKVELMLSDIIWRGTFRVEKKNIILDFEDNYEVPGGQLTFKIKNHNKLIRMDNNTTWVKMQGNSIWQNNSGNREQTQTVLNRNKE